MTWGVPGGWGVVLLAAAAYRLWRLAALDDVLEPLRVRLLADGETHYRGEWFVACAWCLGFWISAALWLAWLVWPHATLVVCVPLAVSAVVGLLSKLD